MKIVNVANRELNEYELESIRRFRAYTDGVSFACLGEGVLMILEEESKDTEVLKANALEQMEAALSMHPDFTTYRMDDGYAMVCLNVGVFAISSGPCPDAGFELFLILRNRCLEACEGGEVLAVVYEED